MVWRCACGLDIILALIFVTFRRTCFSMGDLGLQVSVRLFVRLSIRPSTFTLGVLWAQLLLQFCTSHFETLEVFSSWYEDVHVIWIWLLDYFLSLFPLCEFSHFSTSMYRQWVPCERNSSYNFIPIFLKLCTCFLHGRKICMWFGCNPCFNFYHFFHFGNFVIFWPQILWKRCDSGYLVSATPHTILYRSLWNFAHVFLMVWRCACGLDISLI